MDQSQPVSIVWFVLVHVAELILFLSVAYFLLKHIVIARGGDWDAFYRKYIKRGRWGGE